MTWDFVNEKEISPKNEINKRTNELFAYTNEVNVLPMSLVNRIFFFILISKEFCQQFQHL